MSQLSKRLLIPLLVFGFAVGVTVTTVTPEPVRAQALPGDFKAEDQKKTENQVKKFEDRKGENIDPVTGEAVKDTSVVQYINSAYIWFAIIGGLLAVISLIYAGYTYMASYGDPEKIANAKDIVEKTLIGLALLIMAAVILDTINPRTASNPCTPNQAGCGDIDFTDPRGGSFGKDKK